MRFTKSHRKNLFNLFLLALEAQGTIELYEDEVFDPYEIALNKILDVIEAEPLQSPNEGGGHA